MSDTFSNIPAFDCIDSVNLAGRWRRWRRSFTYYLDARGTMTPTRKKALLLHTAGIQVQDIFETLSVEAQGEEDEYSQAIQALDEYFLPKSNTTYERHCFRQLQQSENETVDQFVTRLRHQAELCNFADQKDDHIRDQFIDKCKSDVLRRQLLEKCDVTLVNALEIARAKEAAEKQAASMVTSKVSQAEVNTVAHGKAKPYPKQQREAQGKKGKCFRCGREGHYAKDRVCPARNETCRKCHKIVHFQSQCRTKGADGRGTQNWPKSQKGRRVNAVEADHEDGYAFVVEDSTSVVNGCVDICIGGVTMHNVLIDSGSTCNLIDKATWDSLKRQQVDCKSEKVVKNIYAYGSQTPLKTLGKFSTVVQIGNRETQAEFIVIDGTGRPILSRDTAIDLKVLRVGPEVNTVQEMEHAGLFDGIGKLKGYKVKLHIDPEVRPVAQSLRRVPYGLRDKVETEIQNLLKQGIIEPVQGPTSWVSPLVIVPKPSGAVRLCLDMRRANEAIIRERHPIPTVDEVLQDLNQSTVFSKLDCRLGFHQLELDEESRSITTFVTHLGLFRYTRLFFGVNSAPELYQHVIRQVLQNCPGAANIADDIIVHGKTKAEHDERLQKVFQTLLNAGLTLNKEKCQFGMSQLEFMGHLISHRGLGPTQTRVEGIREAREPQSATEVRSFLGLVNFCSRFIPNLASVSEPLRRLTKQNVKFEWKHEQKKAFRNLKNAMSEAQTLAFFDKDAETEVIADAGPFGLGAVLVQIQNGERRVICYASRSLSDVECRYSQTEKEALSLVWACERFYVYLCGIHFKLLTDHRPLEVMFGPRSKPSGRIERWVLRLQQFDYEVVFIPGSSNIADTLSRLSVRPHSQPKRNVAEEYIRFVAEQSTPCVISIQQLEKESGDDPMLVSIRQAIDTGDWSECLRAVRAVKHEITKVGKLVLRGTRIIVPVSLQHKLVQAAHDGHQGIVKTKARLRSKLWWPEMDKMAETVCRSCFECQLVSQPSHPEPMSRTPLPSGPWKHLAADVLGPLPDRQYVFVVIDYYSRFFEVRFMKSVMSAKLIRSLDDIFTTHGLPLSLKTDNAQCFVSQEFVKFLQSRDIQHKTSIPLWPQSNGEVERQNHTLLKFLKIAHARGYDQIEELNKFLFAYRTTPHCTTGKSPAELLYRRKVRGILPEFIPAGEALSDLDSAEDEGEVKVEEQDKANKEKGAQYGDKRRNAKPCDVKEGDSVLLQQPHQNKLSTTYKPELYTVVSRDGSEVTVVSSDGVKYRRNVAHVKKYIFPPEDPRSSEATNPDVSSEPVETSDLMSPPMSPHPGNVVDPLEQSLLVCRRSGRDCQKPRYLDDYISAVVA